MLSARSLALSGLRVRGPSFCDTMLSREEMVCSGLSSNKVTYQNLVAVALSASSVALQCCIRDKKPCRHAARSQGAQNANKLRLMGAWITVAAIVAFRKPHTGVAQQSGNLHGSS